MRSRTAFTLIELIVSAILASMLFVALMNIVWAAHQDVRQLKVADRDLASNTILVDQMRLDFQNARGMLAAPGKITLNGFLSRDQRTLQPTYRLGRVQYSITPFGEDGLLVRESISNSGTTLQPMWVGIASMQVEPLVFANRSEQDLPDPAAADLPDVPFSFRITIRDRNGKAIWQEVVNHHAI